MIIKINSQKMIWQCMCGHLSTYNFNYGAVNTKNGPFSLRNNSTLVYRIDNHYENEGVIEHITFQSHDFDDMNSISKEELVDVLSAKLQNAVAIIDHDCVMVQSKNSGEYSCVEVIDGSARSALGYSIHGAGIEHFCCARLYLGFKMNNNNSEDAILLRQCPTCEGVVTLARNHVDYSSLMEHEATLQRRAVNSLAVYLIQNGWLDRDLLDFYNNETYNPTEVLEGFPENEVVLVNL